MGMNLISYPRIVYVQSTEPTDKTVGMIWVDSDDGKTYTSNGTTYNVLGATATIYLLSDDVILSHDAGASDINGDGTFIKKKTITLSMPLGADTIRVKYSGWASSGDDGKGRIYKNGGALGTENTHTAGSEGAAVVYSEDLVFDDGDTLELWLAGLHGYGTSYGKNLRVCGYGAIAANIAGANS